MFLFGGMCEIIYTLHFKSFLHIELVFYVNLTNVSYTGTTSSYYRILQCNQSNFSFNNVIKLYFPFFFKNVAYMCNIGSYKQDIVTFLFSLGCPHFQTFLAVIIFADNLLDNL